MFSRFKLSFKLIAGFAVVALVALVIGVAAWLGVSRLSDSTHDVAKVRLPGVASLLTVEKSMESLRVAVRTLLNPNLKSEDRVRQMNAVDAAHHEYRTAIEAYEPLPRSSEEADLWSRFKQAEDGWAEENHVFMGLVKELQATGISDPKKLVGDVERFRGDHYKHMADVLAVMSTGSLMLDAKDADSCEFGKWLKIQSIDNPRVKEALLTAAPVHEKFHRAGSAINGFIMKGQQFEAVTMFTNEMAAAGDEMFERFDALRREASQAEGIYEKMNAQAMGPCADRQRAALALLDQVVTLNEAAAQASVRAAEETAGWSKATASAGTLAGFGIALALGVLVSLSVSGSLRRIIAGLSEGAEQVSAAAGQVSAASQSLAAGASQQAAGIEEASAALEEMASMTRRTADNAGQADRIVKETLTVVEQADRSAQSLTTSMQEISKASEETSKIIKTIDEIAFQTNLLALNAAVEAARAGAAGAGFAVVADEVRSLAMRAADAAKNTAGLIEGTVKKIRIGSQTVAETSTAFSAVSTRTARLSELVAEIAAASSEQSQGIAQVNAAVTGIDKVTQQSAANAEESASSAEEMSAQAEQMKAMVQEMVMLVEGGAGRAAAVESSSAGEATAEPVQHASQVRSAPEPAAGVNPKRPRQPHPDPFPERIVPSGGEKFKDY
jgi:methyl-accepting chemotaxis protein